MIKKAVIILTSSASNSIPSFSIEGVKRIGIMGGTFDPIHNGHMLAANQASEALQLDHVMFVPAFKTVIKLDRKIIDGQKRYEMTMLAVLDNPRFVVSDIELSREGITFAIDTVKQIYSEYKQKGEDIALFYIIGLDAFLQLKFWENYEELIQLCSFVVVTRAGYNYEEARNLQTELDIDVYFVNITNIEISSTDIRKRLKQGESVSYLVPKLVEDYIYKNSLYSPLKLLKDKLKLQLHEVRYTHSISVMQEAVKLGIHYGCNESQLDKIRLAGLLHDCAKNICEELSFDILYKYCEDNGFKLDKFFKNSPSLAHCYVGAVLAKKEYGIYDEEVLGAIRCHTFAKENMSLIEKIIYVADFIEPLRPKGPLREAVRDIAYSDIDNAMMRMLEYTIKRNNEKGVEVYPLSRKVLQNLVNEVTYDK